MKLSATYRGRKAVKKFDPSDLRAIMHDNRMWCAVGIVTLSPGEASHFSVEDTDILVDVVLQPSLIDVTCRIAAGMWIVPALGEEVLVMLPEGSIAFMPSIVAILSSGSVPTVQAPAADRVVIARSQVVVHDGAGGANPLPTLASVQASIDAIRSTLENLTLAVSGATAGPPPPGTITIPSVDGTTVLKAK